MSGPVTGQSYSQCMAWRVVFLGWGEKGCDPGKRMAMPVRPLTLGLAAKMSPKAGWPLTIGHAGKVGTTAVE